MSGFVTGSLRWSRILLLLACSLASLPSSAHAQVPDSEIEEPVKLNGTVVDSTGEPASHVRVIPLTFLPAEPTTTDESGAFSLDLKRQSLRGLRILVQDDVNTQAGIWTAKPDAAPSTASVEPIRIELKPARWIEVEVYDQSDKLVPDVPISIQLGYWLPFKVSVGRQGKSRFLIPESLIEEVSCIWACSPQQGFDYHSYGTPQRPQAGVAPRKLDPSKPVALKFAPTRPITVTVVDDATGDPLPGVPIYPWLLRKSGEPAELNLSYDVKSFSCATNDQGIAEFAWMPDWAASGPLTFWAQTKEFAHERGEYRPDGDTQKLEMRLKRLIPIRGLVRLPDGSPASKAVIAACGSGYGMDDFRGAATASENGRFELNVSPGKLYMLIARMEDAQKKVWISAPHTGFAVLAGDTVPDKDFDLQPATRLFGKITEGKKATPLRDKQIYIRQAGPSLDDLPGITLPNPRQDNTWIAARMGYFAQSKEDGTYEYFLGPGEYTVRGSDQTESIKLTLNGEPEKEVNFHSDTPEKGQLTGQVVSGDPPVPVAGAQIELVYRHQNGGLSEMAVTDEKGDFKIERRLFRTVLFAKSPDGTQAGLVEIGPEEENVRIPIQKLGTAVGRVIDGETQQAIPDHPIEYGIQVYIGENKQSAFRWCFGGNVKTDSEGKITLSGLIPGQNYEVQFPTNVDADGRPRSWSSLKTVSVTEENLHLDAGDMIYKKHVPYVPPTLEERIASAFKSKKTLPELWQGNLNDLQLGRMRMLIVVADPLGDATKDFFKIRFENNDVQKVMNDFRSMNLSSSGEKTQETAEFLKQFDASLPAADQVLLIVIDEHGKKIAEATTGLLAALGELKGPQVADFLNIHVLPPLDGQQLLDEALAQAKKENKRVLLQEGATWCGPCWMLSRFLHSEEKRFEKDYVMVKMDHRWTHAQEIMERYNKEPHGIPWFVILDADGKPLANCEGPDGNIGFPSKTEPEGIQHFLKMLRETRIRMTDEDLQEIETRLKSGT